MYTFPIFLKIDTASLANPDYAKLIPAKYHAHRLSRLKPGMKVACDDGTQREVLRVTRFGPDIAVLLEHAASVYIREKSNLCLLRERANLNIRPRMPPLGKDR